MWTQRFVRVQVDQVCNAGAVHGTDRPQSRLRLGEPWLCMKSGETKKS